MRPAAIQCYLLGLALWSSFQDGLPLRIGIKQETKKEEDSERSSHKGISKRIGSPPSNLGHLLEQAKQQQQKNPTSPGLQSEATDFSAHLLAAVGGGQDSLLHPYSLSAADEHSGTYNQAAIHQVAHALTKAAEHVAQQHPGTYDEMADEHAEIPYQYHYKIKDVKGLDFGHVESKQGKITEGKYFVQLPDGRLKTVIYWADDSGYHADVQYEGKAKHPTYIAPTTEPPVHHHIPTH